MRVALAVPPAWSVMTPPLGIASIAGVLLRAGHEVKVFDLNIRCWNKLGGGPLDHWDYSRYLDWQSSDRFQQVLLPRLLGEIQRTADEVVQWKPDALGLSLFDTSLHCGRVFAAMVRLGRPRTKVIYGGPAVNEWKLNGEQEFERTAGGRPVLDAAVIGEGEAAMLEVLERFAARQSLDGCLGTAHRAGKSRSKVVFESVRPNMDLNDLPKPYFGDFDFTLYRENKLPVMMSRGCVAKCTFCSETVFWNKYRYREARSIFDEFENNRVRYGVGTFAMADSLINGSFRVLSDLADLVIASGHRLHWHGYARIDKRMTPELLARLAKSGLGFVSYGLETGSQKIMDLMAKKTTVELARKVIRDTHAAGIGVHLNIIVGFPGETEDDFQKTIEFLRENISSISVVNTGETLGIGMDTPLGMDPERFGVRTKADGGIDWDERGNWVSADGASTDDVRRDRLRRLREFLDQFDHVFQFPGGEQRRKRAKETANIFHP
jgi:anaerobic magnesium-protoporphyrin IX monomethyl ester cyclase